MRHLEKISFPIQRYAGSSGSPVSAGSDSTARPDSLASMLRDWVILYDLLVIQAPAEGQQLTLPFVGAPQPVEQTPTRDQRGELGSVSSP